MPSDDIDDTPTDHNNLIPKTTDKDPITWDDNDATLAGALYEVALFWERNALFQDFLVDGVVPIGKGLLAVDTVLAVGSARGVSTLSERLRRGGS